MSVDYSDDDFRDEIPIEDLAAAAAESGIDLDDREGPDKVLGATITRWRDMPAEEQPYAWAELRSFVEWIVTRYELTANIIPHCWYRHGPLVEELSALRAAWDASFIVDTDGGLGPIGWHERFALARTRIRDAYHGECNRSGQHNPAPEVTITHNEDWAQWTAVTR